MGAEMGKRGKQSREWWLDEGCYIEDVWAEWGTGSAHCDTFHHDAATFNRYVEMQGNRAIKDGYHDIGEYILTKRV